MTGRRLPDAQWPDVLPDTDDLRDGDYWKVLGAPEGEVTWCLYYGGAARIPHHFVDEHEDGTISVTQQPNGESLNSVLITGPRSWHGWIYRGVWKEHV